MGEHGHLLLRRRRPCTVWAKNSGHSLQLGPFNSLGLVVQLAAKPREHGQELGEQLSDTAERQASQGNSDPVGARIGMCQSAQRLKLTAQANPMPSATSAKGCNT